jgi:uncharacterized protein (DUF849 family)
MDDRSDGRESLAAGDGEAALAAVRAVFGLEDTPTLPDGRLARDNAELVAAAVASLHAVGRSAADLS